MPSAFATRSAIALRAADEAVLLRPVAGVEVALERAGVLLVARGGDVEEHEQQRELARLGAEDRAAWRRGRAAEAARSPLLASIQLSSVWRVPLGGAGRLHGASTGTSVAIWSSRVTTGARSAGSAGRVGAVPSGAGVAVCRGGSRC